MLVFRYMSVWDKSYFFDEKYYMHVKEYHESEKKRSALIKYREKNDHNINIINRKRVEQSQYSQRTKKMRLRFTNMMVVLENH